MKLVLAITVLTLFSGCQKSSAASLPNCWEGNVEFGSYLVDVDLKVTAKSDLVKFLSDASGSDIKPEGYPIFYKNPSSMLIYIKSRLSNENTMPMQREVESEMSQLIDFEGINFIECNSTTSKQ